MEPHAHQSIDLQKEQLALERQKVLLDYKKFVLGSVFVAIAIALIPPLFQLASALLEKVKTDADREIKQIEFRDQYIKEFLGSALNQDIELRIRFAQYFARVAADPAKQNWETYLKDLIENRAQLRASIDKLEREWRHKKSAVAPDQVELDQIERHLEWAYKEIGYLERNRSAAANPRIPDGTSTLALVFGADISLSAAQHEIARAKAAGIGNATVFRRNGSFRSVVVVEERGAAQKTLEILRKLNSGSYLVDMSSWCPVRVERQGYLECNAA
jgi:hypothetical protein